ncbi:MAG TPA: hypothetical protein VGE98_03100, partial [Thermoanaerobaculia bacterium]
RLFTVERPDLEEGGFAAALNPDSLTGLTGCRIEPAALADGLGDRLQFERQGYFFRDPVDDRPDRPVWNRVVPLRDSWALEVKKQAPAAAPPPKSEPRPAKVAEPKEKEPLSADEQDALDRLRPNLAPVIASVLTDHPAQVASYKGGKAGLLGFFIAQVMQRSTQGAAKPSPKLVSVLVEEGLSAG